MVEDYTGTADLLSLYNVNVGLDDDVFLPRGSHLAIRAPYYKLSANGNYTIRTDHPSDVVKVNATHQLVKQFPWKGQRGTILEDDEPSALKEEGNLLYRKGHHHAAIAKYTTSLETPILIKGSELWRMLRCNRALARLRVFQFDGAICDCDEIPVVSRRLKSVVFERACVTSSTEIQRGTCVIPTLPCYQCNLGRG